MFANNTLPWNRVRNRASVQECSDEIIIRTRRSQIATAAEVIGVFGVAVCLADALITSRTNGLVFAASIGTFAFFECIGSDQNRAIDTTLEVMQQMQPDPQAA